MVKKIGNLRKWRQLQPGEGLTLQGKPYRRIKLELNATSATAVYALYTAKDGEEVGTFLANVEGAETIEFAAYGDVDLTFLGEGEVYYATDDGDKRSFNNPHAVNFTKIATRRSRNPELEMMMFKMEQNMQARMDRQLAEAMRMNAARAEAEGADPETGEIDDGEVDNDVDQGASGEATSGTGGDSPQADEREAGSTGTGTTVSGGSTATK
ncbi:hypothetical protein GCM10007989_02760 [Devosia pacifica]|uniref:Uncharacterized protein n=1 Tax=Devosia pacifica TaxID=1335967 RepID=A0A918VP36_9HYPH|nr:hypothetical protein [Devosia pacifica]GHA11863.1 hypothetical protein GCM10007989_02760 [Devosia pacifica]